MTIEILKNIVAGLLEVPEESSEALGKALGAVAGLLEDFSTRLDAIEAQLRGESP